MVNISIRRLMLFGSTHLEVVIHAGILGIIKEIVVDIKIIVFIYQMKVFVNNYIKRYQYELNPVSWTQEARFLYE